MGISLVPELETIRVRAAKGVLTPLLESEIRTNKTALLDLLEERGERMAIMEYDGGLSRAEAEHIYTPTLRRSEKSERSADESGDMRASSIHQACEKRRKKSPDIRCCHNFLKSGDGRCTRCNAPELA
jgi:hypothetical protein